MKTKLMLAAAIAILPAAALAQQGWHSVTHNNLPMIEGSGRLVSQPRAVARFDRVETSGSANLDVVLGSAQSVVIAADDNVLPLITSEVHGGTLKIGTRGSYRTRNGPRVRITAPSLAAIQTSGSGNVTISNVAGPQLSLTSNGSGNFRAAGRTGRLDLQMRGSGNADLSALSAGNARVAIQGSGNALIRASGALDASVFGSGIIRYLGRPTSLNVQRHGSGQVVAASR